MEVGKVTQQRVLILGLNGKMSSAAARAFIGAGWAVTGIARRAPEGLEGVNFVAGDAADPKLIARLAADADVVVNGLNLAYDKWDKGRAEAQLAAVLEGLDGLSLTLMFPANIYNYAADSARITPTSAQAPATPRGAIRQRMEAMLQRACGADGLQVFLVRAGDFYGPGARGSWFDLVINPKLAEGKVTYPGPFALGHSWAYLPDLGRAYVKLAEMRAQLHRFENFHFAGHFVTGEHYVRTLANITGRKLRSKRLFWPALWLAGAFMPLYREIYRMRYLWHSAHALSDPRLDGLLGADFGTPFAKAMARTVADVYPRVQISDSARAEARQLKPSSTRI